MRDLSLGALEVSSVLKPISPILVIDFIFGSYYP